MTFRIRSLSGAALTAALLAFQTGAAHAQETIVKVGVAGPLTAAAPPTARTSRTACAWRSTKRMPRVRRSVASR